MRKTQGDGLRPAVPLRLALGLIGTVIAAGLVAHVLLERSNSPAHAYGNVVLLASMLCGAGGLWWVAYDRLRRSRKQEKLQADLVIQNAPDGLVILAPDLTVHSFNPAAEHLFGWSAREVVGLRLADLLPPDQSVRYEEFLSRLNRGEWDGSEVEEEVVRPDGTRTPVGLEVAAIEVEGERTYLLTLRDLTARRKLEQTQSHYELMAANSQAVLLVLDADGQILEANPAAEAAYGFSRQELVGRPFSSLLAPGAPDVTGATGSEGDQEMAYETVHQAADGHTFPVTGLHATLAHGRTVTTFAIIRDMTESRRLQTVQELLHQMDHRILEAQPVEQILEYVSDVVNREWDLSGVCVALSQTDGSLQIGGEVGPASRVFRGRCPGACQPDKVDCPLLKTTSTATPELLTVGAGELPQELDQALQALGVIQVLSLPLVVRGQTIGALTLFAKHPSAFGESSRGHLAVVASQLALSVSTAEVQQRLMIQNQALEAADNAIVITDKGGAIQWANPAWQRLTGYDPAAVIGQTPRMLKSGVHPQVFYQNMWDTILSGETWRGEIQNRRKDGSLYLDEMTITPVRNAQGAISHFIAIKQDVTERRRQEEQLRYLTTFDPQTDLPNRRVLRHSLERIIHLCRNGESAALLFLVLEDVDLLTTTLGDVVAQDLMIHVAGVLRRNISSSAILTSWAANQFAVLLTAATEEEARAQAEQLRRAIADHTFYVAGHRFGPSLTCGVAMIDGSLDGDGVIALAAAAVHSAREGGMNRTTLLHPMDGQGLSPLEPGRWAFRIREAILEERLLLHFQPIVRVGTGQIVYYEALVRMSDKDGSLIGPGQFLTAAESFGLMPSIDLTVMRKVLAVLAEHPHVRLFMNLSGQSLGDEAVLAELESMVRRSGQAAHRLVIEITESAAVRDLMVARQWVDRLKDLGCSFALDDFGSGFSSFSYLRVLPVDYVKIDGSFIRNMGTDATLPVMVQAICAVAHALNKQVIAEWVEDRVVAEQLETLGVGFGQGFYWGQPQPLFGCGGPHGRRNDAEAAAEAAG